MGNLEDIYTVLSAVLTRPYIPGVNNFLLHDGKLLCGYKTMI